MSGETQVETRVPAGRLERFVRDLFRAAGVPGDDAETIAAAVVGQEMRGLTTHGLRMVDWNLKGLAEGRISAAPDQRTLSDHGMTAVIEGDHGVGMVGCMKAMRLAIRKARRGPPGRPTRKGGRAPTATIRRTGCSTWPPIGSGSAACAR